MAEGDGVKIIGINGDYRRGNFKLWVYKLLELRLGK